MNVVNLQDYRRQKEENSRVLDADEITDMSYQAALDWAGADFNRLQAVAKARFYRPEWIAHQIERLRRLTEDETKAISEMVAAAGPFLPTKLRWLSRALKRFKTGAELIAAAARSIEYRHLVYTAAGIDRDIGKLVEMGTEVDSDIVTEVHALAADCRKSKIRQS